MDTNVTARWIVDARLTAAAVVAALAVGWTAGTIRADPSPEEYARMLGYPSRAALCAELRDALADEAADHGPRDARLWTMWDRAECEGLR